MMTLREQLDEWRFKLVRARLAGDRDAILRYAEPRRADRIDSRYVGSPLTGAGARSRVVPRDLTASERERAHPRRVGSRRAGRARQTRAHEVAAAACRFPREQRLKHVARQSPQL